MTTCKDCIHLSICNEVENLQCRNEFEWYRGESGCPHHTPVISDRITALKFELNHVVDERNKLGVMYEELLKEKAELGDKIQYLTGMVEAFKIALNRGGV